MTGNLADALAGAVLGLGPCAMFALYGLRFCPLLIGPDTPSDYRSLMARFLRKDGLALAVFALPLIVLHAGSLPRTAHWLGAGVGGILVVAALWLMSLRTDELGQRGFYRAVFALEALALVAVVTTDALLDMPWRWSFAAQLGCSTSIFVAMTVAIYRVSGGRVDAAGTALRTVLE